MMQGRPMLLRGPESDFSLANLMRANIYSAFATLAIGLDILNEEHVTLDTLLGHGGLFKTPGVAQRYLAAAAHTAVTCTETAGEGGPYGMALLAAYRVEHARWRNAGKLPAEPRVRRCRQHHPEPGCR